MQFRAPTPCALGALCLCALASSALAGITARAQENQGTASAASNTSALVRNLEGFLKKYPDYPNRTGIYRALVEANLQLKNDTRAADYAERMVSLNPNDISILLLAIELLERHEDEAGFRRAVSYSTRILDLVEHISSSERSPRVSA